MFPRKTQVQYPNVISVPGGYKKHLCVLGLCLLSFFSGTKAFAQEKSDTGKITIRILKTGVLTFVKTDSGDYHKFIDSVAFLEGSDTLFCDSAYQNNTTKNFEAFGDVKISQQDGTHGTCDYLRYVADKKLAFMSGNVALIDGNNNLRCQELNYDLGTKTGEYFKGGTLKSDSTTVTSNTGVYKLRSKDARFKGKVVITDPKYNIKSDDLGYNTETKVETFYAHSVVISDSGKSILVTSGGTYDSKNVIARFVGHSSIWNDGEYIEADSMHYNKRTGYGYAIGNVISIDTAHHSTLYCGHAIYFRKQRILWAMIKPVMEQVNGKDTLYMRSDTFYSAPMIKETVSRNPVVDSSRAIAGSAKRDSLVNAKTGADTVANAKVKTRRAKANSDTVAISGGKDFKTHVADTASDTSKPTYVWVVPPYKYRIPDLMKDTSRALPVVQYTEQQKTDVPQVKKTKKQKVKIPKIRNADTAAADTTAPMYFVGYHHTLIYSDSLQGKCDSVCYTRSDSTIRMINTPIVWAHKSQITGDTILLYLDSNQLRKMYVPNNAFLISQSGPAKAKLFDQVQGKTLTAWFKDNDITNMLVFPNAECIYYSKDDAGSYLGVDEATSTKMRIFFADQKITNIKFEQDVHQSMTPMDKADLPNMKLSKFKWLMEDRPKTKEELFQ